MVSGRDCERGNPHGSSPAQTDCCSHESSVHGDFPTGSAVQQSAPASQSVTALHHFPSANQCSAQSKINRSCIGGNKYLRWGYYCSICSRPPQQRKNISPHCVVSLHLQFGLTAHNCFFSQKIQTYHYTYHMFMYNKSNLI